MTLCSSFVVNLVWQSNPLCLYLSNKTKHVLPLKKLVCECLQYSGMLIEAMWSKSKRWEEQHAVFKRNAKKKKKNGTTNHIFFKKKSRLKQDLFLKKKCFISFLTKPNTDLKQNLGTLVNLNPINMSGTPTKKDELEIKKRHLK